MAWRLTLSPVAGYTALVVTAASLYGATLPIIVFSASWMISVPLVVATVFPLILYASRNPRLFFLIGMVFTAPLGLSIHMRGHPHMGGAHALSINLMDFFLVPLLVFLARDFYLGYRRDFRFSAISAWWLALAALGAYAVVVGPYREMSALEVVYMLKVWLLFLVIVNECVREKHFHYVVMALMANAVVNFVVASIQFALEAPLGLQPLGEGSAASTYATNLGVYGAEGEVFRVTGLAGHANLFSAYLALLLPIFIGQMYTGYRLSTKVLLAAVSATGVVFLVLTLSRSGWVSFVVSGASLMVLLFALPELRQRHLALKVAMLGSALAGLVVASGPIIRRITESQPGALDFRLEWMGVAWKMVQANPVLGVGLNTFDYHLADYGPFTIPRMYELFGEILPVVHNIYMIIWSEQGTVGFLLFLGMHANILWIAIKNLRYRGLSDRVYLISLAAACGVLAIMVDGLSSFFIKVQAFGRVFWIVVGLIVAAHYWSLRSEALRRESAQKP